MKRSNIRAASTSTQYAFEIVKKVKKNAFTAHLSDVRKASIASSYAMCPSQIYSSRPGYMLHVIVSY